MLKLIFFASLFSLCYSLPKFDQYSSISQIEIDEQEVNSFLKGIDGDDNDGYLNDYADKLIDDFKKLIINNKMDPLKLPNVTEKLESPIPIIPLNGNLTLSSGWLQGLTSLYRSKDIVLVLKDQAVAVTIPIGLEFIVIDYNYDAKFWSFKSHGSINGKISKIEFNANLGYNITTKTFDLNEFSIEQSGRISVSFSGNSGTDWILNSISTIATSIFKRLVLNFVQNKLQVFLQEGVEALNGENISLPEGIQGIISSTLTSTTTTVSPLIKLYP